MLPGIFHLLASAAKSKRSLANRMPEEAEADAAPDAAPDRRSHHGCKRAAGGDQWLSACPPSGGAPGLEFLAEQEFLLKKDLREKSMTRLTVVAPDPTVPPPP